jgi:hypothetical protein
MNVEIRWHDGYKKRYPVNPVENPRIGPDWLWLDKGPDHRFRYVHIPVRSVREVRTDEIL